MSRRIRHSKAFASFLILLVSLLITASLLQTVCTMMLLHDISMERQRGYFFRYAARYVLDAVVAGIAGQSNIANAVIADGATYDVSPLLADVKEIQHEDLTAEVKICMAPTVIGIEIPKSGHLLIVAVKKEGNVVAQEACIVANDAKKLQRMRVIIENKDRNMF